MRSGQPDRLIWPDGWYASHEYDRLDRIIHVRDNGDGPLAFDYSCNQNDARVGQTVSDDLYLWRPDGSANEGYTPNTLNQYSAVGGSPKPTTATATSPTTAPDLRAASLRGATGATVSPRPWTGGLPRRSTR